MRPQCGRGVGTEHRLLTARAYADCPANFAVSQPRSFPAVSANLDFVRSIHAVWERGDGSSPGWALLRCNAGWDREFLYPDRMWQCTDDRRAPVP